MTTQLPRGLINVDGATHIEAPSDPADVVYERKKTLHRFWKVHNAQSRTSHDLSDVRCRQLFWRVWGDRRLSVSLSESTLTQLWFRCRRGVDLAPFDLHVEGSESSTFTSARPSITPVVERKVSGEAQISPSTASISPTQVLSGDGSFEDRYSKVTRKQRQKSCESSQQSDQKPALNRTLSGDGGRKRSGATTTPTKGKSRPSVSRKKSSQTSAQAAETTKPRRSIIKSPRAPSEGSKLSNDRCESMTTISAQTTLSPTTTAELPSRKVSVFELPSASSWQSVESHMEPSTNVAGPSNSPQASGLVVDKNFREKFTEKLRSSTNLAGMNRAMRKTGSIVRFADEVEIPEEFRMCKDSGWQKETASPQFGLAGGLLHRAASEGQQPQSNNENRPSRPQGVERHDSTGSVAAISEDGLNDDESEATTMPLPRTKSQLSLAIADLKRSQSTGEQDVASSFALTSPQIEEEQEALISGKAAKKPSAEEEKLLAMAHKDGVTRYGGVNLPKPLTVSGDFELPDGGYETPEEPLF